MTSFAREQPFGMRCYYGPACTPPRHEGMLAIETRHRTASSLLVEVQAARSRPEIGTIEWWGPLADRESELIRRADDREPTTSGGAR